MSAGNNGQYPDKQEPGARSPEPGAAFPAVLVAWVLAGIYAGALLALLLLTGAAR